MPEPASRLDPRDVGVGWSGFASAKRRKRRNRALDLRNLTVVVSHSPTGVQVEGEIPSGHYSKKGLRRLREALAARLRIELELRVNRALRRRGRHG